MVRAKQPASVAAEQENLMTVQLAIIATARVIMSAMPATEQEKLKTKQKRGCFTWDTVKDVRTASTAETDTAMSMTRQ